MAMLTTGEMDFEGMQHKAVTSNGIVSDDVLLCKSFAGIGGSKTLQSEFMKPSSQVQQSCSQNHGMASSILSTCQMVHKNVQMQQGIVHSSQIDFVETLSMSNKEQEKRMKRRDKKRVQRQNQDFVERERLRARGRIKALREDPVFREVERQRDRERRRKARLFNQTQRMQERDRDKLRKSMMRSLGSKSVKQEANGGSYHINGIG